LETVTDAVGGSITTYEYDLVGNLAKTTTQIGQANLVTTYEYDNMNRLIKLTNYVDKNNNGIFDNGEGVSQFSYTLDNLGRKDYAIEKFWTEYGLQENEIDWEYDEAGRLIYEKFDHYNDEFDQTSEWIYDLVGNRLKQSINGKVTTYDYDVNDRLLREVSESKTTVYDYDHTQQTSKQVSENGNIISETTFEYDLQGRMSVVTIISGNRTEIIKYEYGVDGIRVSAEHEVWEDRELKSKTRTEYLNDSKSLTGYSQVLRQTEYDADGNIVKETSYVIGHQRISQTIEMNGTKTTHYFTFDGHGSTRVLLDAAMTIAQIFAYDAYGNAIGFATDEALTEFLYSGEQFDSKIGQQYLRARYYDSATGRFNRLDPFFGNLINPQSLHKYLYTHADPINGVDPSGEIVWLPLCFLLGGALLGVGAGALLGPSFGVGRITGATIGALSFGGGAYLLGTAAVAATSGAALYYTIIHFVPISLFPIFCMMYSRTNLFLFNSGYHNFAVDPKPFSTTPEWTKSQLETYIEKNYPHAADKAKKSLQALFTIAAENRGQEERVGEFCDEFIEKVRNSWLPQYGDTDGVFRVDKAIFVRRDGFSRGSIDQIRANDHAVLQITFKNGHIAYIDNGWFARCGQNELEFNDNLFGPSNIPPNYVFVAFEKTGSEYPGE
jgi:RHS repeat-associated protein